MTRYQIQFIVGQRPSEVDDDDLDWRAIKGESFESEARAWKAAEAFDADFDHRFTHRVVAVEVAEPEPPRPTVKAAPLAPLAKAKAPRLAPIEGTPLPKRAPKVTRQLAEHRAQNRVAENTDKLRSAIEAGVPGQWLEPLVDLIARDLDECGGSVLTACLRAKFSELQKAAAAPALRVVK